MPSSLCGADSELGEFELIARYFTRATPRAVVGVGDDCAVLGCRPGMQWAVSSDMLVAGRHFFPNTDPVGLGHKALAVNLSDLAACGAQPVAYTLALALPQADARWLQAFSQGLHALADAHGCELVGGDTTRGALTICITVMGQVAAQDGPPGTSALLRRGAQAGDDVWVSGHLGDAHLALQALRGELRLPDKVLQAARQRLERPSPRVALGLALRGVASACADISDGLVADLGHILHQSQLGATLNVDKSLKTIANYPYLTRADGQFGQYVSRQQALHAVLAGGDDYELVFCAPRARREAVALAAAQCATPVTRLGYLEAASGLRLVDAQGQALALNLQGFDHFRSR